jgi:limonene-1,2-epoxide hydrolase
MVTPREVAEAFSQHRFEDTYDHMAENVSWAAVGGSITRGRDAVIAACDEASGELVDVGTTFIRLRTIEATDCVVIDSEAEYVDPNDDRSHVASCDIYDFVDGRLASITSYAVELPATPTRPPR